MKANNLFRFVAIRPPVPSKQIQPLEGVDASIEEILGKIRKLTEELKRPERARLEAGKQFIHSNRYLTAVIPTKRLFEATEQAQGLLQKGVRDPNFHSFQNDGLNLLTLIEPTHLELDKILESDAYRFFKQVLWSSYYAVVLHPSERPQDREMIVTWLLLIHLLESDSEAQFKTRIEHLNHTRPAIPYAFFAHTDESERLRESPPPVPNIARSLQLQAEHLKELESRIASLQETRHTLNDLFVTKLRTIGQAHPPIQQPPTTAKLLKEQPPLRAFDDQPQENPEQSNELQHSVITNSSIDMTRFQPWHVTNEDLDMNAQAFQVVRSLGLVPEMTALPNLINQLGSEIATLSAEASRLKTREEIMLVGKTFVKVCRPLFYPDDAEDMR